MTKITFFFRPKMQGVHSIETLFEHLINHLPDNIKTNRYFCTHKWKRIYSFFKAINFQSDINHITGDINMLGLFLNRNKTILTIHDIGHLERDLKGIKKKIFKLLWLTLPVKRLRYITTISDFTKQKILKEVSVSEEKIIVIPNPAAIDFEFSEKEFDVNSPTILQIGSGNNKNIYRLIEAIKNTTFKLILLRKPDEQLKKLLENHNISHKWYYNVSRDKVYECYKNSDIVFFASEYEGFGVPILEANAVGRPVITSNVSSMPYVAGNSAYFVNPLDVSEIKQALTDLRNDEQLRKNLIELGKENLVRFSMDKIVSQYCDLYSKINLNK
ncbi:glycosyltransferase family 4 protein [Wenyingzhuangia aestuarii]|uniref:glycosyltransferase family 4 protein n=1 Tax=Wenyingzhuangia aestuarii TaxID=1647582 RepID=UPI00143CBA96|nr:glycosyltransferase family 1 protein [Wenyingzhuangia aestuarii]NJB83254.1 glycosyltransferase involved in cell wall biosynthesis [Wenyingzhuangia aestuarii]